MFAPPASYISKVRGVSEPLRLTAHIIPVRRTTWGGGVIFNNCLIMCGVCFMSFMVCGVRYAMCGVWWKTKLLNVPTALIYLLDWV